MNRRLFKMKVKYKKKQPNNKTNYSKTNKNLITNGDRWN